MFLYLNCFLLTFTSNTGSVQNSTEVCIKLGKRSILQRSLQGFNPPPPPSKKVTFPDPIPLKPPAEANSFEFA